MAHSMWRYGIMYSTGARDLFRCWCFGYGSCWSSGGKCCYTSRLSYARAPVVGIFPSATSSNKKHRSYPKVNHLGGQSVLNQCQCRCRANMEESSDRDLILYYSGLTARSIAAMKVKIKYKNC